MSVSSVSAPTDKENPEGVISGRRYRLAPTVAQEERLVNWSGALRALWNAALEQRRLVWRRGNVCIGLARQCRELTDARHELPWLADVPAQAAQQTLRDLDRAYLNFFAGVARYPRFRSRRREVGIRFPQAVRIRRVNRRWGEIMLPKLGWVRFRWSRPVGGEIRHATIKRDALGWHVSLCVRSDARPARPKVAGPVGVDRGVRVLAATSDGELVSGVFWTAGERRRYRALQKRLTRQRRRRSRRRRQTVAQIARLRARVSRRRDDALHKLSHRLATSHALVALEDLDVAGMTRRADRDGSTLTRGRRSKTGLNREIRERAWGELQRQLAYKCVWYGTRLVVVDPKYTSQTCSACGVVDGESRESQARFICTHCGHREHADVNAALVILARGVSTAAGGSPVSARRGLARGRPMKREPAPHVGGSP
jgi:IS605 OrfB family transposase